MKKTFNNHRGCLLVGDRVTVISVDEKKQEIRVSDPFGIEWVVPKEFVFYPL